jgi:hypothetical protein
MNLKFLQLILCACLILTFNHCAKVDPVSGEKILIETDTKKKAEEAARKGGGLFGDIGKKSGNTTYEFATSNVLWRATLQTLDFLPLVNADYSGGVIIYDWYTDDPNSNSQIKVTVRFLNNELRSDSIQVISQKKICDGSDKCHTVKMEPSFAANIKDKILTAARYIKIEESKKETK